MKRYALILGLCLPAFFAAGPLHAQPIESEPLPPPYTMSNETDPMALDGPPPPAAQQALPPAAPPGADDGSSSYGLSRETQQAPPPPADYNAQPESYPQDTPPPPQPAQIENAPDAAPTYGVNSPVSGLPPRDESKFEKLRFCTLKITFGSKGAGPDRKMSGKVQNYLDSNQGKLSYIRSDREGKEGEFSYCVDIPDHKDRGGIYKDLKMLLPPRIKASAPVTMTGKGFAPVGGGIVQRQD